MSALNFSKLGKTAAKTDNLTKNKSFEREVPKEGLAFLRLIGYIETGRHKSKNPAYKPALNCQLIFELSHKRHLIDMDGKMTPQKFTLRLNKGATAKSGYKKVFNQMNKALGGGHETFFEMMGKPLLGEIFHNKVDKDGTETIYANLDNDGAFSFKAPKQEDAISGDIVSIAIPEVHNEMVGFMWENSSFEDETYVAMWDSLYIDGTRLDKDNKEVSKNWIQELIMQNLEWEGSTCQALTQEHVDLDDISIDLEASEGLPFDLAKSAESEEPISM
jgi:hypothetical protein